MTLKNLLKVSCLALLCLLSAPAIAQNKVITGKVTDARDGSPLTGVSVLARGTSAGTTTDAKGNFSLSVPQSTTLLTISYIGYTQKEVVARTGAPISVALSPNETTLNEVSVVSVGYGTQRRKDITGAVSNISAKDFSQGVVINPVSQIQGKVAGLVITQGGGDPNSTASIRLRGQTSITGNQSPLFVVDGIALDDPAQFQNIPPGDIESYDILKDASATAIYGSRGANGVILVNTKKGRAGKATVDYSGYVGMDHQSKYYDLLNTAQYKNAISTFDNAATYDKGGDTDWQKAISRTAYTHSNNLAISSGANGFNYRASVNYQDQQGIILNSDKSQLGFRFNAEQKALNDKLDLTVGISNISTRHKYTDYHVFQYVFNTPPTYPVFNSDGSYFAFTDFDQANPVSHAVRPYNQTYEYLTMINGSANYNILPSLKVGVTGSTSRDNDQTHFFNPEFEQEGNVNSAKQENFNRNSYKADIHVNYDKVINKHSISAIALYEYNDFTNGNFGANGQQYLVPSNLDNNLGGGNAAFNSINSFKEEYKIISFLARVNYNYEGRFYATASMRRDGSSKFGVQHQWGNFPSFDLAYRINKDFLKDVSWIDDLKLRAGYGVVGNSDAIGPYSSIVLYGTSGRYYDAGNSSFPYPYSYAPVQNANPDLRWEERHGRNIGLDFSFFKARLTGDINYYNDFTKNLLYSYNVPTPPFIYNSIFANVGRLNNKGLEVSMTGQIITGDDLNWTASGQIAFTKTRIASLSGTYQGFQLTAAQIPIGYAQGRGLGSTAITYLKAGFAPYTFSLPHYTGVDADGNQLFDGKTVQQYNDEGTTPQTYNIDPTPKFNYGLSNTFNYHNWSLNFFIRGVYGQKIFNNTLLAYETITRLPGNNITNTALTNGLKDAPAVSDKWLENASYLRLDNASLGYTFKNLKGIQGLRLYLAANNLFVITKYRGIDPEVIVADNNLSYIDASYGGNGYYPKTRSFVMGANVSFK
jgi:TonB-linked SusC/RagA family outer membrane protein